MGKTTVGLLALLALTAACSDEQGGAADQRLLDALFRDGGTADSGVLVDAGAAPGKAFARFCGARAWNATLQPATVQALSGKAAGHLTGLNPGEPFKAWTLETIKVIPPHPFKVDKIRVSFAKGKGQARIRLMTTLGRSVPGPYPKITSEKFDLIKPVTIEVKDADAGKWIEIDVSDKALFLQPTQHYMIVYQHLTAAPYLAMEQVPDGEVSRSYLFVPTSIQTYALASGSKTFNYRMQLSGRSFCRAEATQRWFAEDSSQPFAKQTTSRVALADLDGDGHDDLILGGTRKVNGASEAHPLAYLADGKGGFKAAAADPWPEARAASMLVFGDLDNDGDRDALALTYVPVDRDGDGVWVAGVTKPDCNDADKAVYPGATEAVNGYDDDCDGVADDGKDTADKDADGKSIAAGDCDDTRKDVYPGAPELLDGRDNDCDLKVDEAFVNRVLLNDGKGKFTAQSDSGVEQLDPTTAAGLSDANGDGKLDVYWGNWLVTYPNDPAVQDRYFTGQGDGKFTDSQAAAGLVLSKPYSVYGVTWTDYNNDGHQDIFVGNYHMYPNQLWQNQGDGTFKDVAAKVGVDIDDIPAPSSSAIRGLTGGHSYGIDFGDVDNDGDMDYYICNLAHPRVQPWGDPSMFVVNSGAPDYRFTNRTTSAGLIYDEGDVNAAFGDFDNDGDVDLAVASLYQGHYSRLYRNDGKLGFVDVTYEAGASLHDAVGVIWADVDRDGDLDLLQTSRGKYSRGVHLYRNSGAAAGTHGWVQLRLQGKTSNRDAVGARVTLKAGGVTQLRDVRGGGGHSNTQRPLTLHFGLGQSASVTSVTVRWVGGTVEKISGVQPRGRYRVVQGSGQATLIK